MLNMEGTPNEIKRLLAVLGEALQKEANLWKPLSYKTISAVSTAAVEISGEQRNAAVCWLAQLTRKFSFMHETFALSVTILDRFLQSVKARPKHLNCIGVAAFYLAAKTVEEDEVLPGTLELVQESHCGCSISEVLRMERCILDKLNWDLRAATPVHFLHIFHALLMANYPHLLDGFVNMTRSRQLDVLHTKLHALVMDASASLKHPPSVLALALLSLEVKHFWKDTEDPTKLLAKGVEMNYDEVVICREMLSAKLKSYRPQPGIAVLTSLYAPYSTGRVITAAKRKVEALSADSDEEQHEEEDFYDGIKRLYSEETTAAVG